MIAVRIFGGLALMVSAAMIAYAIALPRYQVTKADNASFVVNDRFRGEVYVCAFHEKKYACIPIDPASSLIVNLPQ